MTAHTATTALAAGLETTPTAPGPQNGAQPCVRRRGSTWTSCSCPRCRRTQQRTRKLHIAGLLPRPDQDTAVAVLQGWLDNGWHPSAMASAMGTTIEAAWQILYRRQQGASTMESHTVRRILTAQAPTDGLLAVAGTRRRLQALAWMGWNLYDLQERTGMSVSTLSRLRGGTTESVRVPLAAKVAQVYADLQDTRGPNRAATSWARRLNWAPPAAWDEETIDRVASTPQGVEEERRLNVATYVGDDVLDRIAVLVRAGLNDREIGYEIGRNAPAVQKLRSRYDIRRAS